MGSNVSYISIDPGDKHVGMAFWSKGRKFLYAAELEPKLVTLKIKELMPDVLIVEEFALYPGKAKEQSYSRLKTPRLIGQIEQVAQDLGCEVVLQGASVRKIAERSPYGKQHVRTSGRSQSRHAWDAVCHGVYYFHFGKGEIKKSKKVFKNKKNSKRPRGGKRK